MPSGLADTCKARDKKEGKEFDIETIKTSVFLYVKTLTTIWMDPGMLMCVVVTYVYVFLKLWLICK